MHLLIQSKFQMYPLLANPLHSRSQQVLYMIVKSFAISSMANPIQNHSLQISHISVHSVYQIFPLTANSILFHYIPYMPVKSKSHVCQITEYPTQTRSQQIQRKPVHSNSNANPFTANPTQTRSQQIPRKSVHSKSNANPSTANPMQTLQQHIPRKPVNSISHANRSTANPMQTRQQQIPRKIRSQQIPGKPAHNKSHANPFPSKASGPREAGVSRCSAWCSTPRWPGGWWRGLCLRRNTPSPLLWCPA